MRQNAKRKTGTGFSYLAYLTVAALAVAIVAIGLAASWRAGGFDDAFITYTFASNIAEGHGFVWYQGGPEVYGSSTVSYTLLLALLGYLGLSIPNVSIVFGSIFWAAAFLALFYILKRSLGVVAGLLAMSFGVVTISTIVRLSTGMETGLYSFLAFLAFSLYIAGYLRWSLIIGATLVWTRLDGGLVPLMILIHHLSTTNAEHRIKETIKAAWPSAVLVLAPFALVTLYFGNPLPLTFRAKSNFSDQVSGHFEPTQYLNIIGQAQDYGTLIAVLFILGALVGVVRASYNWRHRVTLPVFFAPLYVLIFYIAGMTQQGWYYVPALIAIFIAFLWGAFWPIQATIIRYDDGLLNAFRVTAVRIGLLVVPLTILLAVFVTQASSSYSSFETNPYGQSLSQTTLDRFAEVIASDVNQQNLDQVDVVAYEVGKLGYHLPRMSENKIRVHDILGLVSPDALNNGGYRNSMYLINKYNPEYIVIKNNPVYVPHTAILTSETLDSEYEVLTSKSVVPGAESSVQYVVYEKV